MAQTPGKGLLMAKVTQEQLKDPTRVLVSIMLYDVQWAYNLCVETKFQNMICFRVERNMAEF